MKISFSLIVLVAALASVAVSGCLDQAWGGKQGSALEPTAAGAPAVSVQPTAEIPADLLEDQLDESLEELEVVG